MSPHPPTRDLKLYYVTDRKKLAGSQTEQNRLLLQKMESAASAGVDWIQIREKDLMGRDLVTLGSEATRRVAGGCRILINDRLDAAWASGAGGVHLGENSIPVTEAKRLLGERGVSDDFLVGVSTHSLEAVQAAAKGGADYVIFGPVFATPSKLAYGDPQGLKRLEAVCRSVAIPVFAIGGITLENAGQCAAAGAAGIAAIRLFQEAAGMREVVRSLRGNGRALNGPDR